jgi:hypothetical protein
VDLPDATSWSADKAARWSESPLVGLYFAVADAGHDRTEGALWFVDPVALNCQAGHRRAFDTDILAFDIDENLADYLPDKVNALAW